MPYSHSGSKNINFHNHSHINNHWKKITEYNDTHRLIVGSKYYETIQSDFYHSSDNQN